ncbi:MAG: DUF4296 domain-containing protein [Flavobacteriales bacterium]|nr:DUF4296 domain-containing protein [Flavobacteriales bacterium]
MKNIFFIFLAVLSISACNDGESAPATLIPREKMAEVLAEVQILEAAYNLQYARSDSSRNIMESGFNQVFSRTGVTREDYETSLNWYTLHTNEMIAIQEDVSDLLLAREADLNSTKKD